MPTFYSTAREEKHEELQEVYERERLQDLADEAAETAAKKRVIAEEANLAGVETLFDDMLKVASSRVLFSFIQCARLSRSICRVMPATHRWTSNT